MRGTEIAFPQSHTDCIHKPSGLFFIDLMSTNMLLPMLGFPLFKKSYADFCYKPRGLFFFEEMKMKLVSVYFNNDSTLSRHTFWHCLLGWKQLLSIKCSFHGAFNNKLMALISFGSTKLMSMLWQDWYFYILAKQVADVAEDTWLVQPLFFRDSPYKHEQIANVKFRIFSA